MNSEVKVKLEVNKGVVEARLSIPAKVHERVLKYQAKLIGRRGEKLTFADACVDLLDRATKSIK